MIYTSWVAGEFFINIYFQTKFIIWYENKFLKIPFNSILEALILNLIKEVGCLFKLSEDIAELDLIMSLARISGIPDFVKPKFAQKLLIIDSKHPIVDLHATQLPRPNDIVSSNNLFLFTVNIFFLHIFRIFFNNLKFVFKL